MARQKTCRHQSNRRRILGSWVWCRDCGAIRPNIYRYRGKWVHPIGLGSTASVRLQQVNSLRAGENLLLDHG